MKLNASQSGKQVNDDELFLQAAGGVNKKGMVYGLGNHTQAFYERVRPSTQSSPSTPIAYTPSMYAQLVTRLQASEEQLNATRVELTLTKEEVKQSKDVIARIDPGLEALALRLPLLPSPSPPFKDLACVVHTTWSLKLRFVGWLCECAC